MKTTDLFVELVVIGMGLFINLLLLCILLFGYNWIEEDWLSAASVLPAIAIVYVLGIIFDRWSDNFTRKTDFKIRTQYFLQSESYLLARDDAYDRSDSMKMLHDYNRSRMRICRSWFIYWGIMAFLLPMVIWFRLPRKDSNTMAAVFACVLCIGLLLITRNAWKSLTHGYYSRLKDYWRLHEGQQTEVKSG